MEQEYQEAETSTEEEVDEKKIIDQLFKEKDNYQKTNEDSRNEVNDIYNAYMGRMDDVKKVPYFEPISIPKLRTEVSYIVPFIYSGQPEIEIEPVGEEDKAISQVLEKIVNYRISQSIPQAYEKIEAWVKQSVTFGTSLLKVNWKFEVQDNEDGTQTPIKDEPQLEVPNILDCFYNPIISDVEQQDSLIFRSVLPVEEVKKNPAYDFVDNEGNLNREKAMQGNVQANQYDSSQQVEGDKITLQTASEGTVEVYERISKDRLQTVCVGKERYVLRDVENHYGLNVVKLIHEPNCIPNRFGGMGVGQNTLGLGKGFHSIINQTKQNITLANNPRFMYNKGANIDKKQLVSTPGSGIEVDGDGPLNNNIVQVDFADIKNGALDFIGRLDDEHKRASGANDLVQGAASNKTLGQDELASSYSSNRFELITRRFKEALADLAKILIEMELKNLQSPDSAILRIFPAELRPQIYQLLISEDAKNAEYNVKVKGDTTIAKNKDIQIKQLIDAYNIFGAILPPENQMAWARKILELRGIDELDTLVPDPQQYAQQQQQMQMEQQAIDGQAMPQGGTGIQTPQQQL